MFTLKINLLLLANCILAVTCLVADIDISSDLNGQAMSPNEADAKINWGPVWDDNEGINEFVTRNSGPQSEEDTQQKCKAPNSLGLQHLFEEAEKLLPRQQIKDIVNSYAEDPEIKALKAFVSSPQTKEKVKALRSSQEYQILKDYMCRILHIDLLQYNQLIRTLINPILQRTNAPYRTGIRGLIDEINAVLPRQQLRELYKDLLASDDELVKAVENLKSQEFHQLLLNIKNNVPEYKALRGQLIALGVPVGEMRELLANAFGWAPALGLSA